MSNAPYCPVSRSQPTQDHRRLPRATLDTTIPPAVHDLRTVINAINIMNNIVQTLTRGEPQINNTVAGVQPDPPPPPFYVPTSWQEVDRAYTAQDVVNPENKDQYVTIKTLVNVTWQEFGTGHQFRYEGA